jgi:membrane-associated phospholipid phosphatase
MAAVVAFGINQVLNQAVNRPRPYAVHHVHLLLARSHDASFPSDHTAVAFAVAVSLWAVRPRLGTVLAVLGALLGLSRVIAGVHYPGDILGGALVGALSAAIVCFLLRRPIAWITGLAERLYEAALTPLRRRLPVPARSRSGSSEAK